MLHYPKWWQVVADNTSFWCAPLPVAEQEHQRTALHQTCEYERDCFCALLRAAKVVWWVECRSRLLGLLRAVSHGDGNVTALI